MSSDASWLNGRRVFAISIGYDMLAETEQGLRDLGAHVLRIGDELDLSSRESVASEIDAAIAKHGAPELLVLSVIPASAMRVETIETTAEADWCRTAVEGLRATMRLLQAFGPHLKRSGGAIVFVAPSLSLVGAAGLVALSTLLEGQRGLMKSVARQWGAAGVTLNWVSAAPRALAPFEGAALAAKPDAVSVALGRAPDPRTEIAPILGFLASKAGRGMTGATLMADGGEWMVP